MTFDPNSDHDITLAQAAAMTKNYRDANPSTDTILGHAFGKNAIAEIMAQAGCVGIRIYYALNEAAVKQVIIVGVDADGNDLYNGRLAERSFNCPPSCGAANALNS